MYLKGATSIDRDELLHHGKKKENRKKVMEFKTLIENTKVANHQLIKKH